MKKLKCIIVDDEQVSRDVLKKYIKDLPNLQLVGECRDAFEATSMLAENEVDLIFLDINMPGLSGIGFAKSLSTSPMIVFTTAYPEYAVEGFELEAVDYLVKPFSAERFMKSVNRSLDKIQLSGKEPADEATHLIKADKKIYAIKILEIQAVEGCGDYIKVHLSEERKLIVHDTIKAFLASLPSSHFMRIHKSYAVNLAHVEYIEGNMVSVAGNLFPVSPNYKQELLENL